MASSPLAELLVSIIGDVSDIQSAFDSVGKSASSLGTSMQNTGKNMSMYITAPLTAVGVASFKTAMDFDDSMRQVQAVTGTTGESLQQLTDYALQLGADTAFSSSQAAEAMFELGQAGYTVDEIMTSTDDVLALASASSLDLGTSAEIASNVINGFGLEVSDTAKVVDILAQASSSTNADVQGLGEALSYAAPTASALGLSLEETTAMLGILADNAITGSRAGTTLNGAMSSLISPSSEAAAALAKYGISLEQVNPETNKFTDVLGLLQSAGISATDVITIFGREAGPGVTALLNTGIDSIDQLTVSLENSDGAAQQMAETMEGGIGGTWRAFTGSVETLSIKLGDLVANAISPFIARATELVNTISNLPGPVLQTGVAILGLAMAAGPTLIALGTLIRSAGTVMSLFGGFPMLLGPVGIALAGVAAAGALIYTNWDTVGPWLSQQFNNIRAAVDPLIERVRNLVTNGFGYISNWWSMNGQAVMNSIMATFQRVVAFVEPVYTAVRNLVVNAFQLISNWWTMNGQGVMNALTTAFQRVITFIEPLYTAVRNLVETGFRQITNWWSMNGQAVLNTLYTAFDRVRTAAIPLMTTIRDLVERALTGISNWWGSNGSSVLNALNTAFTWLVNTGSTLAATILDFANRALVAISNWWSGSGRGAVSGLWQELLNVANAIKPLIPIVISFVQDSLNRLSAWWSTNGPAIMQAANNLGNAISWAFNNIIVPAIKVVMALLPPFLSLVQSVWGRIGEYTLQLANTINWFAGVWRSIQPTITGVINAIVSAVTGLYNSVTNSMNGLSSNWSNGWNGMLNIARSIITTIYNTITGIINSIINFVVSGISRLTSSWSSGWNGLLTTARNILNSVVSTVSERMNSIVTTIQNIINRIKNIFSTGFGDLPGIASTAMSKVVSAITGHGSSLYSAGASAGQQAVNGLASKVSSMQSLYNQYQNFTKGLQVMQDLNNRSSGSSGSTGITRQGSDGTGESRVRIVEAHATGGIAGYTGLHWMEEGEMAIPQQTDWDAILINPIRESLIRAAQITANAVSSSSRAGSIGSGSSQGNVTYGGDTFYITANMSQEYDFDKMIDDANRRATRDRFRRGITS